jgi:hypothetical protein
VYELMKIFVARVEVEGEPQADVPEGAFVNVFIPAQGLSAALRRLLDALDEDGYGLIDLEFIDELENIEFDSEDARHEYQHYARQASHSGHVVYSDFFTWEAEDEDGSGQELN